MKPSSTKFSTWLVTIKDELPQALRTLLVCVLTYTIISMLFPGNADLTGTISALLISQGTVVGTFRSVVDRVSAVVVGVGIAVWLGHYFGLNVMSVTIAIGISLLAGIILGLKDNRLEVPISALLILAASQQEVASDMRMLNTFIGVTIGLAVTIILPLPPKLRTALVAVGDVVDSTAELTKETAKRVEIGDTTGVSEHLQEMTRIIPEVEHARDQVHEVRQAYLLNSTVSLMPSIMDHRVDLLGALDTLEKCLPELQQLTVAMELESWLPHSQDVAVRDELRLVYASSLKAVGSSLSYFSNYLAASGKNVTDQQRWKFNRSLRELSGARDLLMELSMLPVEDTTSAVTETFLRSVDAIYHYLSTAGEKEFKSSVKGAIRDRTYEVLNGDTVARARRAKHIASRPPRVLFKGVVRRLRSGRR